jgi:hypothetical protein
LLCAFFRLVCHFSLLLLCAISPPKPRHVAYTFLGKQRINLAFFSACAKRLCAQDWDEAYSCYDCESWDQVGGNDYRELHDKGLYNCPEAHRG